MSTLVRELRALLSGVMFLTRIPVPGWVGYSDAALARSTAYFPVVGLVVGAIGALTYSLAHRGLPVAVCAVLAVTATVLATGAFHEDGLADSADGFGGGQTREQMLSIMKDSRVGSYGAVAVALAVAARVSAIAALGQWEAPRVLVAAHVLARWSALPLIHLLAYVRDDGGKARPFAAAVTRGRLVAGTVLAGAIAAAVLGARWLPAAVAAVTVTALAALYFRRRLGGITGDCLGATNQLVEIAVYLVLAWRW